MTTQNQLGQIEQDTTEPIFSFIFYVYAFFVSTLLVIE